MHLNFHFRPLQRGLLIHWKKRIKMLTFLSLIAANILHELNYIELRRINQEKAHLLSRFLCCFGIIDLVLEEKHVIS